MQTISISYGHVRIREWLDRLNLSPGERKLFECLAMAARGKDHAWPEQEWLARKVNVTVRTIRNYIRRMEKREIIQTMKVRINGCLRLVYYFLAHPVIVAAVGDSDRKKFPVRAEEFSGHLIKRKENKEIPPTPQRGNAAAAAKERAHEQQSETQGAAPSPQRDFLLYRRSVESARLRVNGGGGTGPHADGLRGESKTLQQTALTGGDAETNAVNNGLTAKPWQTALALLLQQMPQADFDLWIKPICAYETENNLKLDCPDQYCMAYVQARYGNAIRSALHCAGITDFSFSFGEHERLLQKKKEEELRAVGVREEARWAEELSSMPLEEQFAVLVAAYPRKTSGNWFAWRTFRRLARRGELPEIGKLLRLLKTHKQSEDWIRDAGRWIPGLSKWLNNKP